GFHEENRKGIAIFLSGDVKTEVGRSPGPSSNRGHRAEGPHRRSAPQRRRRGRAVGDVQDRGGRVQGLPVEREVALLGHGVGAGAGGGRGGRLDQVPGGDGGAQVGLVGVRSGAGEPDGGAAAQAAGDEGVLFAGQGGDDGAGAGPGELLAGHRHAGRDRFQVEVVRERTEERRVGHGGAGG